MPSAPDPVGANSTAGTPAAATTAIATTPEAHASSQLASLVLQSSSTGFSWADAANEEESVDLQDFDLEFVPDSQGVELEDGEVLPVVRPADRYVPPQRRGEAEGVFLPSPPAASAARPSAPVFVGGQPPRPPPGAPPRGQPRPFADLRDADAARCHSRATGRLVGPSMAEHGGPQSQDCWVPVHRPHWWHRDAS